MSSFSERAAIGAFVLVLAIAPAAHADPSPADVESAKAQYVEGIGLRDQGDQAGALVRFRAAFALVPTPITALEVGRSLLALGKVLDGRDILIKASHMPKVAGESARADEAREEAAKLADAAKRRLATLTVAPLADDKSILLIDGATIPHDAAVAPRVVDPGHHVVDVHGSASEGHLELDLAEGEQRTVEVPVRAVAPPPPGPFKLHPLVFVGFGVGAVGLLGGAATGIGALVTTGKLADDCPNRVCPASSSSTIDTSKTLGTISTIAFIAGGAGVVLGVVGLLLSKHEPPNAAFVRPTIGFLTLGLEGEF